MTPLEKRIEQLEFKLAQVQYELARKSSREAAELSPRHGRWLGITREDFVQGEDEFFEIDLYLWFPDQSKWKKVIPADPPGFLRARDWFLNDGEEVEKLTKVKVEWYETTWVVTAMYCSPTDLEEFQPTTPQSPGELEQEQLMQQAASAGQATVPEASTRGIDSVVFEPSDAIYQYGPAQGSIFL